MEMNLSEMRTALRALNEMNVDITIDPQEDKDGWKAQWDKKDRVQALRNKLSKEISRLQNEEDLNNPDEITKMMLALEKK